MKPVFLVTYLQRVGVTKARLTEFAMTADFPFQLKVHLT